MCLHIQRITTLRYGTRDLIICSCSWKICWNFGDSLAQQKDTSRVCMEEYGLQQHGNKRKRLPEHRSDTLRTEKNAALKRPWCLARITAQDSH
ncbi:uncharacterized protein LOC143997631 isoform X2 [Lithobates pipiens]